MRRDISELRNERYCCGIIADTLKRLPVDSNTRYYPELARYPGDPEAYVSSRSEIINLAKRRGWKVEGFVEYEPPEFGKRKFKYEPAPDIVERYTQEIIERDHDGKVDDDVRQEIRDTVKRKISGNYAEDN